MVSAVAKSMLRPSPGAGLVADPVRPLPKPADPQKLARVLGGRLAAGYASLPEHERLAAVTAVQDTFAAAGELTPDRLFAADLDPGRLADALRRPVHDLADRSQSLYEELLRLCCAHAVEQLTAHPAFAARAAVEQTRRTGALLREREAALSSGVPGPARSPEGLAFEQRYAGFVARTHSRLELFGVTLGGRRRAEWPLDTAYLSLAVSGETRFTPHGEGPGVPDGSPTPVKVEQALSDRRRLLLRGPAGSGKSTLMQWLALNAARQTFGPELAHWNTCVPFVLRLRSFNTPDGLPLPEDFLSASGVPLRAPQGWAEELLAAGRALVLVDGVDEVPPRLRARTEQWLRSLLTAFPQARYVVTTRPSAVPEDWLASQGFTAHTLLPMEREDIRAFVRHWHDAARQECAPDGERELLDRYEASLSQAVTTRRDLGRLATNPLMCALLCALHRDRHMHLPRARKELYDAALDMLLVRRDTEREISSVEGAVLSREEQTALLQRLAYWMIRNGQVEAARDEVAAMLDEWLTVMPQVRRQGDAEQVFAHLLIRSGLLREPVPGYVDFVHRTFQDHLGAKAAVEARDFGVLVRNAHDDQWDDVVRMAVGHARVDERGRLLRQLLRRADKVRRHRHRLVLLAAASLEHAPELDPVVRREVEARAAELMPPRTPEEAAELAKVGELVLELLPGPEGLDAETAGAVVRTAALVGGPAALAVIARFREDTRFRVTYQLSFGWRFFDAQEYADAVLAGASLAESFLHVVSPAQVRALDRLPHIERFHLKGNLGVPEAIVRSDRVRRLFFNDDDALEDLSPLSRMARLELLGLDGCPRVRDLSSLAGLPIERLHLHHLSSGLSLAPIGRLTNLRMLSLDYGPRGIRSVADIPTDRALTGLGLSPRAAHIRLDGLGRWPRLDWLTVSGAAQSEQLARLEEVPDIGMLQILNDDRLDPRTLARHRQLAELSLYACELTAQLDALKDLPELRRLSLSRCSGTIDLTPLAGQEHLTIHISPGTDLRGADLLPPERLKLLPS
ncbi:ATP-binding protein [Streptomyces resistomycificus]|uniref:ATP-binding protein n=1 Tax=Streptomyces resistomycificus TaxID=67356 RepID=A0A0L8KS60_9ACTN|nr:ATP-binding protein [Streptomyces resistomycificus]KUN91882.1 ATP-binding protein [Streptomyces resistomycificus]